MKNYLNDATPTLFAHPEELKPLVSTGSKSTRFIRLKVQRRPKDYGISDRAFSICAPKLWNKFLTALKNELNFARFKRDLEYLFRCAFNL